MTASRKEQQDARLFLVEKRILYPRKVHGKF